LVTIGFFLNEYLGENTTLLDFDTLYDFDYDDFCLQEQTREQESPGYTIKPYRGGLDYCWARLEIDGIFHYANLSMAAHHLYSILDESGFEKIGELIPHDFVDGKDHGKREGNGFIWDLQVDAAGMEKQLDELQHRYYSYLSERRDAFLNEFDEKAQGQVYLVDKSRQNEPQIALVFTDKTALQAVRFRHFMRDCRRIIGDKRELEARAEQERQASIAYLERHYQDILDNFDPKIVKFRKKRKIIIEEGTLKDLL
jgi:hypothetical protein